MTANRSLVLLGDSILDNAPYTNPEPDTTAWLRRLLDPAWSVECLARDGAVIAGVPFQLKALAGRPDVLVLSVGGNDLVRHLGILDATRSSSAETFGELLDIADEFAERYEEVARLASRAAERTLLCTIYEVRLEPPHYARLARPALAVLNDRIFRIAANLGLDVIDLRLVCDEAQDFVLQIEPSPQGAAKIARAIAAAVVDPAANGAIRVFGPGAGFRPSAV